MAKSSVSSGRSHPPSVAGWTHVTYENASQGIFHVPERTRMLRLFRVISQCGLYILSHCFTLRSNTGLEKSCEPLTVLSNCFSVASFQSLSSPASMSSLRSRKHYTWSYRCPHSSPSCLLRISCPVTTKPEYQPVLAARRMSHGASHDIAEDVQAVAN